MSGKSLNYFQLFCAILLLSLLIFIIEYLIGSSTRFFLLPVLFIFPGLLVGSSITFSEFSLIGIFGVSFLFSLSIYQLFLYFWTFFLHQPFSTAVPILGWLTGLLTVTVCLTHRKKRFTITGIDYFAFLVIVLTVLPLTAILVFPRVQFSYDGAIYTYFSYQIRNGFVPPSNQALFNQPANTYWLFSEFIAFLSTVTNSSPPVTSGILSYPIFFSILTLGILLAREFFKGVIFPLLSAYLLVFGLALHNTFIVVGRLLKHPAWLTRVSYLSPLEILSWTGYFLRDGRLTESIQKITNFEGFRLGYAYFLLLTLVTLKALKKKDSRLLVAEFFILNGMFLFHPTTALAAILLFPAVVCFTLLFSGKSMEKDRIFWVQAGVIYAVTLLLAAPYFLSASDAMKLPKLQIGFGYLSFLGVVFRFFYCGRLLSADLRSKIN